MADVGVNQDLVEMDAANRAANPGPIDTSPAAFAPLPGPRNNAMAAGVNALATGKDPQHAMAAELGQKNSPQVDEAAQTAQTQGQPPPDYMRWDEVVKQEAYLRLPLHEREKARNQYFQDVIAPQVNADDLVATRKQFDADTTGKAGYDLLPTDNDDPANRDARANRAVHLQYLGVPKELAERVAASTMPPISSQHKTIIDQGVQNSSDASAILGYITPGTAGMGVVNYLKSVLANKKAAAAAAQVAAREAEVTASSAYGTTGRFSGERLGNTLAADAAANAGKVDATNPFNASGLGEDVKLSKDAGWAGDLYKLPSAAAAELRASPALQKAYTWAKAHPAFGVAVGASAASSVAGTALGIPNASLLYHIARSLKGIARLLPEVSGE